MQLINKDFEDVTAVQAVKRKRSRQGTVTEQTMARKFLFERCVIYVVLGLMITIPFTSSSNILLRLMGRFVSRDSPANANIKESIASIEQRAMEKRINTTVVPSDGFAVGIHVHFWELFKRRFAVV